MSQNPDKPELTQYQIPITRMLESVGAGDPQALGELYARLYPELKRLAHSALYKQGSSGSMHTTMLVHESYLKLLSNNGLKLQDRRHFFAYAAKTMRNLIIDSAREQMALWRGGGVEHVTYTADHEVVKPEDAELPVRIDEALRELESVDPELAELVEMRYFGGYTDQEVAELLEVSERTVRRRWDKARAWLMLSLSEGTPGFQGAAL